MKLFVWAPIPSTGGIRKAFKKALSFYFLKRTLNSNFFSETHIFLKDSRFFIVSAFFEMGVNLRYGLFRKCREFKRMIKEKSKQTATKTDKLDFSGIFLSILKTGPVVKSNEENLDKILRKGNPVLLVANHPYPPIDGLILMNLVQKYRQDFSIVVNSNNSMLSLYPELTDNVIGVHMSDGLLRTRDIELVRKSRIRALKKSIASLNAGQCLIIFPAGQGSKAKAWGEEIRDPEWLKGPGLIVSHFAKEGKSLTVLPVFIEGHMGGEKNSQIYQKAVIETPAKVCAALQHAFFNAPPAINLHVGIPLTGDSFEDLTELSIVNKLREKVYCHAAVVSIASSVAAY